MQELLQQNYPAPWRPGVRFYWIYCALLVFRRAGRFRYGARTRSAGGMFSIPEGDGRGLGRRTEARARPQP